MSVPALVRAVVVAHRHFAVIACDTVISLFRYFAFNLLPAVWTTFPMFYGM